MDATIIAREDHHVGAARDGITDFALVAKASADRKGQNQRKEEKPLNLTGMRRLGRRLMRYVLRRVGLELHRAAPCGADLGDDLRALVRAPHPVVLDVGANAGQFLTPVRSALPHAAIHAFEPSPEVFETLQASCAGLPRVTLNNVALGVRCGEGTLLEHTDSVMSSFLPPVDGGWEVIRRKTPVPVLMVDRYCAERGIEQIDLLKTDTEGYDLEVLRGAERMLREGRVSLVLAELLFRPLYRGLAEPDAIYRHLRERGFRLVTCYRMHYYEGLADAQDALFVHTPDRPATKK